MASPGHLQRPFCWQSGCVFVPKFMSPTTAQERQRKLDKLSAKSEEQGEQPPESEVETLPES